MHSLEGRFRPVLRYPVQVAARLRTMFGLQPILSCSVWWPHLWRSFDVSFQLRGFNVRGRVACAHGLHWLGDCTASPRCNLTCGVGCEADQRQSFVGIMNCMLCRPSRLHHALTHALDCVHGGRRAVAA